MKDPIESIKDLFETTNIPYSVKDSKLLVGAFTIEDIYVLIKGRLLEEIETENGDKLEEKIDLRE